MKKTNLTVPVTYADELEKYANRETCCFFSHGGQITVNGWGQCSLLSAHPGVCLLAPLPPHPPTTPPNILYFKCHPPCATLSFSFFFKVHPPCHRVSAAITFSITSQWEVNLPGGFLSEPITAGGQAEVKWHDLWVGWSRRGGRCGGV